MSTTKDVPTEGHDLQDAIEAFTMTFVTDLAAVAHAATVVIGDKLGLYRAIADAGSVTPAELAARTGCDARLVAEWLAAQAASGYAHHDATTGRYYLDAAQAACLADEGAPTFLAGGMAVVSSGHKDEELVTEAFRTGAGVGWHQHHHDLFLGTERFFRPGYVANLASSWIPAVPGLEDALRRGTTVADVGCGHGSSTILMGESFPASRFVGFDYHAGSVAVAEQRARSAGVSDRVTFAVAPADELPGTGYGLVTIFDALHDMGDPVAAARRIHRSLAPDGVLLLVEPNAGDRVEDNLNLVGRIFYSASTLICTPAARHQGGPDAACLGAQAGEARLRTVLADAGFGSVDRVAETPFNMVLAARP
ncbi:MAG: class I SAM-dependent methyltransferase [Acidimicrobiia bacterium]